VIILVLRQFLIENVAGITAPPELCGKAEAILGTPKAYQRPCSAAGSSRAVSGTPDFPAILCIYMGSTSHSIDEVQSSMHPFPLRIYISNKCLTKAKPNEPRADIAQYLKLIGKLMYLMCGTRPDIAFIVVDWPSFVTIQLYDIGTL